MVWSRLSVALDPIGALHPFSVRHNRFGAGALGPVVAIPRDLWVFYGLTILLAWLRWTPMVLDGQGIIDRPDPQYSHFVGSLGPLAAAILVRASRYGRGSLRRLFCRVPFARAWGFVPDDGPRRPDDVGLHGAGDARTLGSCVPRALRHAGPR